MTYADGKLKKLCTDDGEMKRRRADIAKKLRLRINALEIASTVGDLPALDPLGRWHPLKADRAGQWAGSVSSNERIVITPGDSQNPMSSVSVEVIEIVDYHSDS